MATILKAWLASKELRLNGGKVTSVPSTVTGNTSRIPIYGEWGKAARAEWEKQRVYSLRADFKFSGEKGGRNTSILAHVFNFSSSFVATDTCGPNDEEGSEIEKDNEKHAKGRALLAWMQRINIIQ